MKEVGKEQVSNLIFPALHPIGMSEPSLSELVEEANGKKKTVEMKKVLKIQEDKNKMRKMQDAKAKRG